jgi:SAM-dependent methyltransferase
MPVISSETPVRFYDDLAGQYHLIYEDWPRSMEHQGRVLSSLIRSEWPHASAIADVACGIGTQAIPLASQGFTVAASDLSESAVQRATGEASLRQVSINARVDDMRRLQSHDDSSADVVIACDNAIPHLLSNEEILTGLRQLCRVTRPGGGCILSVRDYARIERSGRHLVPFGIRSVGAQVVSLFQVWDFEGETYKLSFFFVYDDGKRVETRVFRARYYAVTIDVLLDLMERAGFTRVRRIDDLFFQPLILGTRGARTS